jgi:hypothetical protein
MDRRKLLEPVLMLILIIALLAPRIPALDSFSTLDEPYWLSMGANFYYALGQREFENTIYEYQPAVTTMWVVTFGMLFYYPEYRGLGQGYLEYEKGVLDPFMLDRGKDPLKLLEYSRLIQVFIIGLLFLVCYILLKRLVSKAAAFFTVLFASFDPFFLGQSRLLDHEALLSLFVIASLVSLAVYLSRGRKVIYLLLSGVMAGLAQLTKSSALAMVLPAGLLFLIELIRDRREGYLRAAGRHLGSFALWMMVIAITYFVFWPGMWVAPGKMLYEVYGNAFSYAFQGARLKVTGEVETSQLNLNANLGAARALTTILLWRTTPWTWLGAILGFILPFTRDPRHAHQQRQVFALLLACGAAFILLFGFAQGRDSPHYILASYLSLNLLGGLGWYESISRIADRLHSLKPLQPLTLSLVVLVQVWSAVSFYPYYYTHRNPILQRAGWYKDFPQFAYGEGLELAAQHLASLPGARDSVALVYYARGCFSYFFPGETTRFKPYYVDGDHQEDLLNSIRSADYIVVYYATQGALEKYAKLIQTLSVVDPIHEVWLDGYKYVMVYQVATLPESVFEILSR